MKILLYPNPILRQIAQPIIDFGEPLKKLVADLKSASLNSKESQAKAVGLAANQIGSLNRVFLISMPDKTIQPIINPQILKSSHKTMSQLPENLQFLEGCLSFPGYYGFIDRPIKIKVHYWQSNGLSKTAILTPPFSAYFQHERDHLDGILFIDYLKKSHEQMYQNNPLTGKLKPIPNPFL